MSDKSWDQEFQSLNVIENFENIETYPLNMLNNFCFHVYAQKSLIISEIGNVYFLTAASSPSPVSLEVIELVPG